MDLNRPETATLADAGASSVKLSDLVYAKIIGRIRGGDYAVNDRLPTENELAEMLSVSRPIVREALARLRTDGVVMSRRGSGTYVRNAAVVDAQGVSPLSSIGDMRRCLEFRVSFEGESAWHAAAASFPAGRAMLATAMRRLEDSLAAGRISVEDDFNFHFSVAHATGNRFFEATMLAMRANIITGMGITPSFMPVRTPDRLALLHAEHIAIHDAVMADDPGGARDAMRSHLTNAMRRVFDGVD